MRTRMLVAGAVTAAIALGAASTPSALAASGWTPPINFPLPSNAVAQTAQVTYENGGTATVAYLELVSQSPLQTVLHVGVIPPGGAYQEELRIPSTSTAIPGDVALAEAPGGATVLEWAALQSPSPSSPLTYFASYRPAASKTWQTPATIATDTTSESGISERIVPAISADGTAAAGIDHVDPTIPSPGGYRIDVSVHPAGAHVQPSSGAWGTAQQISPPSDSSEDLGLGFDANGNLTAAFRLRMGNGRYTLAAVNRPGSNGIWGTLQDLTGSDPTSDVEAPRLGVGPSGSAVIAFQYVHHAAPNTLDVNAVTRSGQNGSWSAPADVAPGGSSSAPLAVGVSPTDAAYILYRFQGTNSGLDCIGAVSAANLNSSPATFGGPHCASPTNFEAGGGGMTMVGDNAYFAWTGQPNTGTSSVVEGSQWPTWLSQPATATDLDSPASNLTFSSIVDEGDGNAVAFWTAQNVLRAAAFQVNPLSFVSAGQSSRRWSETRKRVRRHKHKHKVSVGTTFQFALNQAATVDLTFDRVLRGRRVSGTCRPQNRRNRHRPRCSSSLSVGSISTIGQLGPNNLRFTGRIGRKRLAPGTYKVTFTAVNTWAQQSSRTLRFTIVGR